MLNEKAGKRNDEEHVPISRLLGANDAAEILGISVKTVHKLVREGRLGCVQVTAKERRFTEEQIRAYIEAQSQGPRVEHVDMPRVRQVSSPPTKGGGDSVRFSRRSLKEEMRQWQ